MSRPSHSRNTSSSSSRLSFKLDNDGKRVSKVDFDDTVVSDSIDDFSQASPIFKKRQDQD